MRSGRNRRRRTTRAEYLLLFIITVLVFFLPDFYLHMRQKYFSKNLKIHHVADIRFNRITQTYQDIEQKKDGAQPQQPQTGTQSQTGTDPQTGAGEVENVNSAQNQDDSRNSTDSQVQQQTQAQQQMQAQQQTQSQLEAQQQAADEMDGVRVVKLIEDTPAQEQVFVTNSQIAIISEEKLTAYSKQGEKKWEAQINAPEPYLLKSKEFIYVVNKQKGDIAKINQNNEIVAIVQNLGKITNIKVSEDYVVFTSENPNDFKVLDGALELYSYFSIPFGDVVDFQISTDSKNIIANILNIDEFNLESYILTYDIRGQIIGTADINKQLVYSMKLDENMIVVSDVALMSFDKNGLKSTEIPNTTSLIDVASYADKVYTLSTNEKNQEHTDIVIYSQYLNKLSELELKSSKEGILAGDKFCIIYDYKDLELYDNRLNFISRYQINEHIDKMEWIDEYSFAIIGDGIVNVYEIR